MTKETFCILVAVVGACTASVPGAKPTPIPQAATTTAFIDQPEVAPMQVLPDEPQPVHQAGLSVAFEKPACATCAHAYRPQPAMIGQRYQPIRRGLFNGRFRRG